MPRLDGFAWRHRHTVLLLSVAAYFGVRFVEFALSLVYDDIEAALGISPFVVGVGVAASTVTYASVQLPSGALGARFGERPVVSSALALTAAGSVLLAATWSGAALVLGMALIGLVSGAYYSPATALLTRHFEETGRAIGTHRLGAQVVGFTGPLVALVGVRFGWRHVLLLGAVVALPTALAFRTFVNARPPTDPKTPVLQQLQPAQLRAVITRPSVAFTTGVAALAQFVDTATFSFLPWLLREYHDVSAVTAGALFSGYFVTMTAGQPVAGWAADRFGTDSTASIALALGVVGFGLLLVPGPLTWVASAVFLAGVGMGWGPPLQSRLVARFDEGERGVGFGLARSVYIGFAALNGVVVGATASRVGWAAAILVLASTLLLAVVALVGNALAGSPY